MATKKLLTFLFILIHAIASGQTENETAKESKPFTLGLIDEIYSKELSEKRILNIYLPEGYGENDSIAYPVVYLLDGSADEDFIHIVGLYHFNSFPWIERTPKSIIVGIANVDRKRDFTFATKVKAEKKKYPVAGHSDKFIAFIEKELQPYINTKYRTNSKKTIIGQSLGGLLAAEILLKKPHLFYQYIIVSPSLWWDNASLLKYKTDLINTIGKREVYIGVGREGLAPSETPHVMEVEANVLADKLKNSKNKNLEVYFDYLPGEDHAAIMHIAVYNALKYFNAEKEK